MVKRKSNDNFIKEVYNLVENEYTVLGKYVNNSTKIKMKHNICGTEWEVNPNSFLRGSRCPKCFGTPKKTQEEFIKEIYNLVGNEYSVIGKYINANTKIKMRHNCNKCHNYEWEILPHNFFKGHRCPKCSGGNKKRF